MAFQGHVVFILDTSNKWHGIYAAAVSSKRYRTTNEETARK